MTVTQITPAIHELRQHWSPYQFGLVLEELAWQYEAIPEVHQAFFKAAFADTKQSHIDAMLVYWIDGLHHLAQAQQCTVDALDVLEEYRAIVRTLGLS